MNTYFTSDAHFGHANIIKYCNRPFATVEEMNATLIRNWNARVKPEDLIYHLGDFCFKTGAQGGKTPIQVWESQLNGKIIHIMGNHDKNNGMVERNLQITTMFGNKLILMQHIPPKENQDISKFDLVLCGHVHEKWQHTVINKKLVINVGCDVHNFMPISRSEVIGLASKIERHINENYNALSDAQFNRFVKGIE